MEYQCSKNERQQTGLEKKNKLEIFLEILRNIDPYDRENYSGQTAKNDKNSITIGEELYRILEKYNLLDVFTQSFGIERKIVLKGKIITAQNDAYYEDFIWDTIERVEIPTYIWNYDVFTNYYLNGAVICSDKKEISGNSNENKDVPLGVNGMTNFAYSNADGYKTIMYEKKQIGSEQKYIETEIESEGNLKGSRHIFGFPRYLQDFLKQEEGISFLICEHYKKSFDDLITNYGMHEFQECYNAFEKLAEKKSVKKS